MSPVNVSLAAQRGLRRAEFVSAMNVITSWHGIDLQWAYGGLLHAITRRTRCRHQAHDALHDAFVRYAAAPGRPQVAEPQAYFWRVVQSVLVDRHRDAQRAPLLADLLSADGMAGGDAERDVFTQGQFHPSPEDLVALRQRLELLQRVLDGLPPRCREVFWLFRIEGHTQPEIAQNLGVSLNMVERHVMRALVDLRMARAMLEA